MHTKWVAALILCTSVIAGGQDHPPDRSKPGRVSGFVVNMKSGEPVRKALVLLHTAAQPKGIGSLTDSTGSFLFESVEPGNYIARVECDGYVTAKESLGQVVTVQAGELAENVKLNLLPTGAISGRVLDADGEPLAHATVVMTAVHSILSGSAPGGYAATDDRGEYRAYYIAPGEYKLFVMYKPHPRPPDLDFRLQNSAGEHSLAYPPVYYPGTFEAAQAATINVEPGNELRGMDLHLMAQRAVKIRGHVTGLSSTSPIAFAFVTLSPIGGAVGQGWDALAREGDFELTDVLPGTYRLDAMAGIVNEPARLTGRAKVVVGSSDIEGIQLAVGLPQKVTGQIIPPENGKVPSGYLVLLESRELGDTQGGGMAMVGAKGDFVLNEVPPGEYSVLLHSTGETSDMYVSTIKFGDTDALTHGVSVGKDPLSPLEISLKENGATLEVTLTDEKGKPLPAAKVLLVPSGPREQQVTFNKECKADVNGVCHITGIAPGEYYALAFPTGATLNPRDTGAMETFKKLGKALKFAEGDKQKIGLTPPN